MVNDPARQEVLNRKIRYVDGSCGNHADIVIVGDHAYQFYFVNIPANMYQQGLAIYVLELITIMMEQFHVIRMQNVISILMLTEVINFSLFFYL